MPQTYGMRVYNRNEAFLYVSKLGCWSYANPTDAIKRRDVKEYKKMLRNLIITNRDRVLQEQLSLKPGPGTWETEAAIEILIALKHR